MPSRTDADRSFEEKARMRFLVEFLEELKNTPPLIQDAPKAKRKFRGEIYLVKAANWLYKIGKSTRPRSRVNGQAFAPVEMELLHTIETDDMGWLEGALHKYFGEKRVRGEWFRLSWFWDVPKIRSLTFCCHAESLPAPFTPGAPLYSPDLPTQAVCLALYRRPKPFTLSFLAGPLGLTREEAFMLVCSLEARGFAEPELSDRGITTGRWRLLTPAVAFYKQLLRSGRIENPPSV